MLNTMKNYIRLILIEQEEISRGLARGKTLRQITNSLARPPSIVSSELCLDYAIAQYPKEQHLLMK